MVFWVTRVTRNTVQLITLTVMNLIINSNEELFLRCYHLEQFSEERISRNDFFFFSIYSVDAAQYDVKLSS